MIKGVALLAGCMFSGFFIGEMLGTITGINSNVGGVGFAMLLLILITAWLKKRNRLTEDISNGILFWQSLYIPIVIAMAATQNVIQAAQAGTFAIVSGLAVVAVGFVFIRLSSFIPGNKREEDSK